VRAADSDETTASACFSFQHTFASDSRFFLTHSRARSEGAGSWVEKEFARVDSHTVTVW
jgi:hypothetical protein